MELDSEDWRLRVLNCLGFGRAVEACVKMGYAKKAKELWKILDKEISGSPFPTGLCLTAIYSTYLPIHRDTLGGFRGQCRHIFHHGVFGY